MGPLCPLCPHSQDAPDGSPAEAPPPPRTNRTLGPEGVWGGPPSDPSSLQLSSLS